MITLNGLVLLINTMKFIKSLKEELIEKVFKNYVVKLLKNFMEINQLDVIEIKMAKHKKELICFVQNWVKNLSINS